MPYQFVSLFSGIDGLSLGFRNKGFELVLACEKDDEAARVLKRHVRGIPILSDVYHIINLPEDIDLVVAGFPCTDVSRVGNKRGLAGEHTGLVDQVWRLLEGAKRRPPWVLLENVVGLLDRNPGYDEPAVRTVTRKLENLGYRTWAHRVLTAKGFGIPQTRERVFILASMDGDARDVLLGNTLERCDGLKCGGNKCFECLESQEYFRPTPENMQTKALGIDLAHTLTFPVIDMVPTLKTGNHAMVFVIKGTDGRWGMGALSIRDAERIMGFPEDFTKARHEDPGNAMIPDRFRLLGNAVCVPVAEWIADRLLNMYVDKYTAVHTPLAINNNEASWPRCAWYVKGLGHYKVSSASTAPMKVPFVGLTDFLKAFAPVEKDRVLKYCDTLKEKVKKGIIKRQNADAVVETVTKRLVSLLESAPIDIVRGPGDVVKSQEPGPVVWAKQGDKWWPGIMLDPFMLPPWCDSTELPWSTLPSRMRYDLEGDRPKDIHVCIMWLPMDSTAAHAWVPYKSLHAYKAFQDSAKQANQDILKRNEKTAFNKAIIEGDGLEPLCRPFGTYHEPPGLVEGCGRCGSCRKKNTKTAGCFLVKAQRVLAMNPGHVGACLALMCGDAIGKRVGVYWGKDDDIYDAVINGFDLEDCTHHLTYDDGDEEDVEMWDEDVTVLN